MTIVIIIIIGAFKEKNSDQNQLNKLDPKIEIFERPILQINLSNYT